jgi:type VI secretion system secreted protein VgrG
VFSRVATLADFRLEGPPMPADTVVEGYEALEALSRPFEIDVDFYTTDATFDVDSCLTQALLLTVVDQYGVSRSFHGVVDRAEFVKLAFDRFYFHVHMVPALSALAYREDCRIFQNKSIIQVIATIFTEAGFNADVQWQLKNTYTPREYIVQYRESMFNFVSRLMEDDGILYFFQHAPSGHTMVVADSEDAFQPQDVPGVQFQIGQGLAAGMENLEHFTRTRSLRQTNVQLRDYDFEKPQLKPESTLPKPDGWPMIYYEYPGGFIKSADGTRRATARMRELRRDVDVCRGDSRSLGLRIGAPFMVSGAREGCLDGEFVITSLHSRGSQIHYEDPDGGTAARRADAGKTERYTCDNEFTAIPNGSPWAPPRLARKPRIRGIQTVVVSGPSVGSDQSIHCDNYGRIIVHFFWDRVGQQDENASCWLRVNQAMMGGTMILPRVGWELSVAFLDGDPDRPVAVGRLYNAANPPPDGLPGAKASGSLKSMSSPGGAGQNVVGMVDTGGKQGHAMSAQKDLNITVGNNKTETIAVDENHAVTVNMSTAIGNNESLTVSGNQTVTVGSVMSQNIGGNQSITIGGADTTNADSNLIEHVVGARSYSIGGTAFTMQNGIEHTITGNLSRDVGAVQVTGSVGSIEDNIVGSLTEKVGAVKVILAKGNVGETVSGSKTHVAAAAAIHLTKGGLDNSCDASVTRMIGALHQWKVGGDISLKGDKVMILGATGTFTGGGSVIKLGGGPAVLTGSKVTIEAPLIVKVGGTMKIGPG